MRQRKYTIEAGEKINMLTAISETDPQVKFKKNGNVQKNRQVKCQCDCGVICDVLIRSFKTGHVKSCGCLVEITRRTNTNQTKHGLFKHPLNYIWAAIRQRCYNPNHEAYHRYGGRGITVCDEWMNDFMAFYNWAISNGWKKGLQVDRFPNNDGNYEPSNCRVTAPKNNSNNRRDNVIVSLNGKEMPFRFACEELKLNPELIYCRMQRNGFDFNKAIKLNIPD